jgi:heterogeneous nuclear ribonucleoprotein R
VKALYIRDVPSTVTDANLQEKFEMYGKVDKIQKVKDFAFVHFDDRESAEKVNNFFFQLL